MSASAAPADGAPGLVLLVPGWPAPEEGAESESGSAGPDAPAEAGDADGAFARCRAALAWRRGPEEPVEATLLRLLGLRLDEGDEAASRADVGDVASANAWAHDLTGESLAVATRAARAAEAGQGIVRADPVHLSPDRDTAMMLAPEALGLTDVESDAIAGAIDAFVRQDGLRLLAAAPTRWYLVGPGLPRIPAPPPQALAGRRMSDLDAAAPDRPPPAGVRSLLAELEMLLHGHPVNAARRARGALPVTGLHLHGSARAWHATRSAVAALVIEGDDPFARVAAHAANVPVVAAPDLGASRRATVSDGASAAAFVVLNRTVERAALAGDSAALDAALEDVSTRWLAPALDAGSAGASSDVSLHVGGGRVAGPRPASPGNWSRRTMARLRALLR